MQLGRRFPPCMLMPCTPSTTMSESAWNSLGVSPLPSALGSRPVGVKNGGLGLRSSARHATASYLASVAACEPTCRALDRDYRTGFSFTARAAAAFQAQAPSAKPYAGTERQQELSQALDAASLQPRRSLGTPHRSVLLRMRLRLPIASHDGTAPCAMGLRTATGTTPGLALAAGTE